MSNLTIGMIVGSLRKASFNRQLAQALVGLLPSGATAQFIEIGELPLYNQDLDASLPEPVQRFKAAVAGVDTPAWSTGDSPTRSRRRRGGDADLKTSRKFESNPPNRMKLK